MDRQDGAGSPGGEPGAGLGPGALVAGLDQDAVDQPAGSVGVEPLGPEGPADFRMPREESSALLASTTVPS